jgi:hypothetical protein
MPKSVHITAPRTTHEERIKQLRIPKMRERELQALVDEFKAKLCNQEETRVTSIEPEKRRKRASAA